MAEYCTKCGSHLDPDLRFCPACGAEVHPAGTGDTAPSADTGAAQGVSGAGAGGPASEPGASGRPSNMTLIIIANVAAVLIIASVALGAYFIFRGDDGGQGQTTTRDKTGQETKGAETKTSTTQTTGTNTGRRTLTTPVLTVPLPQRTPTPTPTPTPAPTPAPTPVPATPAPPSNTDLEAAEMTAMLDVVRSDPYYGGGDNYVVISYDPVYNTGTVLITYYFGDIISYTECYMAKDQYGWYVYDDYSYQY